MRSIAVTVPRLPCRQCQLQAHANNSSVSVLARVRRRRFVAVRSAITEASGEPAPMGQKTRYSDNWLDKAFMSLFASKMNRITGHSARPVADFDDFVAASRRVMQGRDSAQQREVVRQVLLSILPPGAPETFSRMRISKLGTRLLRLYELRIRYRPLQFYDDLDTLRPVHSMFRKLFPPTKWAAEFNAAITVPFFYWLVGPAEVVEVEVNGIKQKSGVHIKKCRYLEHSGCVGMCINMCKLPTQDFFTKEFGLPLTMNPNFEDMSCDMVYGQQPPTPEEDPTCKQPCYASFCSMAQRESEACPKLPV